MTKAKNSEVRLCCYSYSDYCLKATALWCYLQLAFVRRRRWNVFSTDSICLFVRQFLGSCSVTVVHRVTAIYRAVIYIQVWLYLSTYLPTYLAYLPTYLPTYLTTYLPTHLPTYLPTYPPTYLPTYLPTILLTKDRSSKYGSFRLASQRDLKETESN